MSQNSSKESKRRLISFQDKWFYNIDYKEWLIKKDEYIANCKYCKIDFTTKYEGVGAIKTHFQSNNHKKR